MTQARNLVEQPEVTEFVVAAARSGDHASIGMLAGEAFRTIVSFYRFTGVPIDHAEEIAADTVERIITNLPTLKRAAAYEAWKWTIARNTLRSYWRAAKRSQPAEPISPQPAGPEELAVISEEHAEIVIALRTLSLRDQELLWLREVMGLGYSEIAARIGSTPPATRVAAHRARSRLQKAYASTDMD